MSRGAARGEWNPAVDSSPFAITSLGTADDHRDHLVSQRLRGYTLLTVPLYLFLHIHTPFAATAGIEDTDVRPAGIRDLNIAGAYFAMPNPFSKGASIFVKIRTDIEFFQSRATVARSTEGVGMTVIFHNVSLPFLLVLQGWILDGMHLK